MRCPRCWGLVFLLGLTFAVVGLTVSVRAQDSKSRSSSDHPDLAGVYFMQGKVEPNLIDPAKIQLTPWGDEHFKSNRQYLDPDALCLPTGVPKAWQVPAPFEIIPLKNRVLIFYEHDHMVRQIHMDRREHPKDVIPSWMGDSVGWWEGDTLVVDTAGFNELTPVDLWGLPHSDQLHVVERIHRISPTVLQIDMTITDPKAFTKPWMAERRFDLHPDWQIGEEVCEENNAYLFPPGKTWPTEELARPGKK